MSQLFLFAQLFPMINIFYNNITITISEEVQYTTARVINSLAIDLLIEKLKNSCSLTDIVITGDDENKVFNSFSSHFKYIEAAGGVVKNTANEFLIIKRMNTWDLPKGKIDKGETVKAAAIREVCEETGLTQVEITDELPHTYHIYNQKNRWYLKKTYWFLMETLDKNELKPQFEEDITEALWMSSDDAADAVSRSYRSISDTLSVVFD